MESHTRHRRKGKQRRARTYTQKDRTRYILAIAPRALVSVSQSRPFIGEPSTAQNTRVPPTGTGSTKDEEPIRKQPTSPQTRRRPQRPAAVTKALTQRLTRLARDASPLRRMTIVQQHLCLAPQPHVLFAREVEENNEDKSKRKKKQDTEQQQHTHTHTYSPIVLPENNEHADGMPSKTCARAHTRTKVTEQSHLNSEDTERTRGRGGRKLGGSQTRENIKER